MNLPTFHEKLSLINGRQLWTAFSTVLGSRQNATSRASDDALKSIKRLFVGQNIGFLRDRGGGELRQFNVKQQTKVTNRLAFAICGFLVKYIPRLTATHAGAWA